MKDIRSKVLSSHELITGLMGVVLLVGCSDADGIITPPPDDMGGDEEKHYGDADTDVDTDGDIDIDNSYDTDSGAYSDADADGDWSAGGGYSPEDMSDEENPANQGDSFEDVGTNPFVETSHDPFSTFAADVDTASYDIFRRDIHYGYLPRPASIRLEEFVNYFAYAYEPPAADTSHPFKISMAAAPNLFGRDTTLLRIGIQGELPPPTEKKPANLVFLIDVSGSMSDPQKLPLVQKLLTSALDVLEPGDMVSIVTYASNTGVRLEPTDISQKDQIASAINSLKAGGSTAGAGGINLAYNQAEAAFIENGINHIILCTDGDFNVGISSDEELVALIEEKRKTGITLTVLGFGTGNLNDSMMEKLSNAGNGIYGVIASEKQARDYAEKRLLSNLVFIAKDMKIQVEFNPKFVKAYRLLGYENRAVADEDFQNDKVDGGEIGAGHRVTALYELVRTDTAIPEVEGAPKIIVGDPVEGTRTIATTDMALVKVRYKDPAATEEDAAHEVREMIDEEKIAASYLQLDEDFRWAAAIAAFAEILKDSPYAQVDALDQIEDILTEKTWLDEDRAEFVELFKTARKLLAN